MLVFFLATNPLWYPDSSHMRLLRKKEMTVLGTLQGSHRGPKRSTVLPEVRDTHATILVYSNPSSSLLLEDPSEVGITTHVSQVRK